MANREFPLTPVRTADLEVGDFWAVQLTDGRFGCFQVTDVRPSGPLSRTAFYAAVVDWTGAQPPSAGDILGRDLLTQGLTPLAVLTEGGAKVIGNASVAGPPLEGDNLFQGSSSGVSRAWDGKRSSEQLSAPWQHVAHRVSASEVHARSPQALGVSRLIGGCWCGTGSCQLEEGI